MFQYICGALLLAWETDVPIPEVYFLYGNKARVVVFNSSPVWERPLRSDTLYSYVISVQFIVLNLIERARKDVYRDHASACLILQQ